MNKLLRTALSANHIILDEPKIVTLERFLELLTKWNRVFNLTAITDPSEMVYLHIVDSLAVQPYLHGQRMLDVGSGAGLPGLPLAIAHPEQQWVLLDKNSKKTRFQFQTVAELHLANVETIHNRSEDFQPGTGFDSILSRAFGTLRMFVDTTAHLLGPDGMLIALKGKYPQDELDDLPQHFVVKDIIPLNINGIDIERHIVRLQRKV